MPEVYECITHPESRCFLLLLLFRYYSEVKAVGPEAASCRGNFSVHYLMFNAEMFNVQKPLSSEHRHSKDSMTLNGAETLLWLYLSTNRKNTQEG